MTSTRATHPTTALALGVVGTVTGIIPILFLIALPCGILAVVLGRRRVHRWGFWLGVVAIALSVSGMWIVGSAVDELDSSLTCLDRAVTLAEMAAC